MKIFVPIIIIVLILAIGVERVAKFGKSSINSISSAANSATSQNAQVFGVSSMSLPAEDVAGQDIPGIKRDDYLVRTKYQEESNTTTIEYKTHSVAATVLSFYRTQLANADWVLDYSKENKISFLKDSQRITLVTESDSGITTLTCSIYNVTLHS